MYEGPRRGEIQLLPLSSRLGTERVRTRVTLRLGKIQLSERPFWKGAYAAQAMIRRHDVTETGDTCNLVPGLLFLLSSRIEPLC